MSKINENLIKLFDYKNLFQIKISEEVIRRFILDKDVGFGIKYHFNSNGFVDELNSFTENELQAVYRLLQNPSIERKPRGWIVMGSGQALVRIMMRQRWFKMYVYYLFKANQHKKYTDVLDDRKLPKFEDFEEFTR